MLFYLKSISVYLIVIFVSVSISMFLNTILSDEKQGRESLISIMACSFVIILIASYLLKKGLFLVRDLVPLVVGEALLYFAVTVMSGSTGFDSVNLSWIISGNIFYILPWLIGILLKSFRNSRV